LDTVNTKRCRSLERSCTNIGTALAVPFNAIVLGLGHMRAADFGESLPGDKMDLVQMMLDCAETMTSVLDDVTDMSELLFYSGILLGHVGRRCSMRKNIFVYVLEGRGTANRGPRTSSVVAVCRFYRAGFHTFGFYNARGFGNSEALRYMLCLVSDYNAEFLSRVDEKVADTGGFLLFTTFRKLPGLDLGCEYHPYCSAAEEKNRLSCLKKQGQSVQVASSTSTFCKFGRCQPASGKLNLWPVHQNLPPDVS
jgi:hypothetical protein